MSSELGNASANDSLNKLRKMKSTLEATFDSCVSLAASCRLFDLQPQPKSLSEIIIKKWHCVNGERDIFNAPPGIG